MPTTQCEMHTTQYNVIYRINPRSGGWLFKSPSCCFSSSEQTPPSLLLCEVSFHTLCPKNCKKDKVDGQRLNAIQRINGFNLNPGMKSDYHYGSMPCPTSFFFANRPYCQNSASGLKKAVRNFQHDWSTS